MYINIQVVLSNMLIKLLLPISHVLEQQWHFQWNNHKLCSSNHSIHRTTECQWDSLTSVCLSNRYGCIVQSNQYKTTKIHHSLCKLWLVSYSVNVKIDTRHTAVSPDWNKSFVTTRHEGTETADLLWSEGGRPISNLFLLPVSLCAYRFSMHSCSSLPVTRSYIVKASR